MIDEKTVRESLKRLIDWEDARVGFDAAVSDIAPRYRGLRAPGAPHTLWQLVEHIRIAQGDILDFSTNPEYEEMRFPDDYWPKREAGEEDWNRSVEQVLADLRKMRDLVADPGSDLFKPFDHGSGQTLLREAMLVADHNAYHIGQLMLLRRIFENS